MEVSTMDRIESNLDHVHKDVKDIKAMILNKGGYYV